MPARAAAPNARAWEVVAQLAERVNDKNTPRHMLGRDPHVVALEQYLNAEKLYDPILDGLLSAVRYDKTYFDKIVASLLPLLEKLTTGTLAALLAPDYHDLDDPRPIFDWQQASARKRWSMSGWMRCPTRWSLPPSAIRCLPIW
jgi:hypothetical protein